VSKSRFLCDVAAKYPNEPPRDAIGRALCVARGDTHKAAIALRTTRPILIKAINAVGLRNWLDRTYPAITPSCSSTVMTNAG
jgi:hypothetical protein